MTWLSPGGLKHFWPSGYFAKKRSEQKVQVKEIVVNYGIYQIIIRFETQTLSAFKKNDREQKNTNQKV